MGQEFDHFVWKRHWRKGRDLSLPMTDSRHPLLSLLHPLRQFVVVSRGKQVNLGTVSSGVNLIVHSSEGVTILSELPVS